jgi:hypothetical protein
MEEGDEVVAIAKLAEKEVEIGEDTPPAAASDGGPGDAGPEGGPTDS